MREIKLRAWDALAESMIDWKHWNKNNTYSFLNSSNFTVLQFTGLVDRNGVEVYEGDIIQFNWQEDQDIGVVAFIEGCFRVTQMKRHVAVPLFLKYPTYEVIGNIYEHHELLEVGK